jgi:hypothetical protein
MNYGLKFNIVVMLNPFIMVFYIRVLMIYATDHLHSLTNHPASMIHHLQLS